MTQRGLPAEDEEGRAVCCALWNGLYSAGSVVGPLTSAALYARCGWLQTTQLVASFCALLATALVLASEATYRTHHPAERCKS